MNIYKTQIKRELWENKVSFIYAPAVVSLLILALVACVAIYTQSSVRGDGIHFNVTSNGVPLDAGITPQGFGIQARVKDSASSSENLKVTEQIRKIPDFFNGMIVNIMYANCVMLYLVFLMVLSSYALRCLFDDRKNKDILFWRSIPVSETQVVITKLFMIILLGPLVISALNLLVTVAIFVVSLVYFTLHGIELSYLLGSVFRGGALYIPFQIFYELVFSLLMLFPVIGFALFSSAYARKTPFFIFVIPFLLLGADKILTELFGVSIGVSWVFSVYNNALVLTKDAFELQHPLHFTSAMILPLLTCIAVGTALVSGAIWLRNNRYEI